MHHMHKQLKVREGQEGIFVSAIQGSELNTKEVMHWWKEFCSQGMRINFNLESGTEDNVMPAAVLSLVKTACTLLFHHC